MTRLKFLISNMIILLSIERENCYVKKPLSKGWENHQWDEEVYSSKLVKRGMILGWERTEGR